MKPESTLSDNGNPLYMLYPELTIFSKGREEEFEHETKLKYTQRNLIYYINYTNLMRETMNILPGNSI